MPVPQRAVTVAASATKRTWPVCAVEMLVGLMALSFNARSHRQCICLNPHANPDHLSPQTLPQLLQSAQDQGFRGLNITFRFKKTVLPLLDTLSVRARALGAVNTVYLRNGRTSGHNTDASRYSRALHTALPHAQCPMPNA